MTIGHSKMEATIEPSFLRRKPFQYDLESSNLSHRGGLMAQVWPIAVIGSGMNTWPSLGQLDFRLDIFSWGCHDRLAPSPGVVSVGMPVITFSRHPACW